MARINFKTSPDSKRVTKNLATVLFSFFAGFFNWFIVLVCAVVLISGYWFLIRPKYEFIVSDQEVAYKEREYEDKINYLKQLNELKNLYKTISQDDRDKIDFILSLHQDMDALEIALLREIGYLGKTYDVKIDNVVITPLDNSQEKLITIAQPAGTNALFSKLQLVEVSFQVESLSYAQLQQLLAKLEGSLRIMDITNLTYTPEAKQAQITLVTYYLPQ